MKVNCVMLVRDRPELTYQAITTMFMNAGSIPLNLTIMDDGSSAFGTSLEDQHAGENIVVVRLFPPRGIVGLARNFGIRVSEQVFGRGDFLYLADNDSYHCPRWLETLTYALTSAEPRGVRLLGGTNHPYHQANTHLPLSVDVRTHNAVAGLSHLMRWDTYDRFGPFDANAKGVGQSEDFAFCRRIVEAGFMVGSVYPRVVLNCGLVDSYGKPCIGYEAVKGELLGEIKARGLEGKVWFPEVSTHDPVKSLKMPNW
jgi:hypothetical protein